jgi:hypothetical protein
MYLFVYASISPQVGPTSTQLIETGDDDYSSGLTERLVRIAGRPVTLMWGLADLAPEETLFLERRLQQIMKNPAEIKTN